MSGTSDDKRMLNEILPDPTRAAADEDAGGPRARTADHLKRILAASLTLKLATDAAACGHKPQIPEPPHQQPPPSYGVVDPVPPPPTIPGPREAPLVAPARLDGGGTAFLVTATNFTLAPIRILPDGLCRMRIDGSPEAVAGGGSGGAQSVAPGETWRELVKLVSTPRDPSGRRPPNPQPFMASIYREVHVQLSPGSHAIEFNCGRDWSDQIRFDWPGSDPD